MRRRRSTRSSAPPARPGATPQAIAATAAGAARRRRAGSSAQIEQVAAGSARTRTETDALAGAPRRRPRARPSWSGPSGSWARSPPTSSGSRGTSRSRHLTRVDRAGSWPTSPWAATWATAPRISRPPRAALAALPDTRLRRRASRSRRPRRSAGWTSRPTSTRWCCWRPALEPRALLAACQAIERTPGPGAGASAGAPRTLDLDIVRYGDSPRSRARPDHSPSRSSRPRLLAARAGRTGGP